MNNSYPNWRDYEKLYRRYLHRRDPVSLFCHALQQPADWSGRDKCFEGKRVLDLASGTGRLTEAAAVCGATRVDAIEQCARMCKPENYQIDPETPIDRIPTDGQIRLWQQSVREVLERTWELNRAERIRDVDFAFCQQAINYWFEPVTIRLLADVMKYQGTFVFTTFNERPPEKPTVKQYWESGRNYVEISYLTNSDKSATVHHFQSCEGVKPHVTSFAWIPPETFDMVLSEHFAVHRTREGKTDIYRCVKV